MPFAKLVHTNHRSATGAQLSGELLAEWRNPHAESREPIIIKDGGGSKPVHLYVIWSAWQPVDQLERSEIIMDVYEQVAGIEEAANVTIAMGLTEQEAHRLGIYYR
ncbi:MAG TPA: hypothetical protein VH253_08570 [Phycisphaerae bacterium]|nr:hypothetical protein [Phycisphaerae bacterium]